MKKNTVMFLGKHNDVFFIRCRAPSGIRQAQIEKHREQLKGLRVKGFENYTKVVNF